MTKPYRVRMVKYMGAGLLSHINGWVFYVYGINGKAILKSKVYLNKAQARNCGSRFARLMGLEWKE